MIQSSDIQARYGTETGLLVLLCRHYFQKSTPGEIDEYIACHRVDWDFFYQLAAEHGVITIVSKATHSGKFNIPTAILNRFQQSVRGIAGTNIGRLQEILRLQEVFDAQGLKVVPVKGVILSYQVYGDFAGRSSCDIDSFIEPDILLEVINILKAEGYISESYFEEGYYQDILANTREHKMSKTTATGAMKIEIQWQVALNVVDVPLSNYQLLQQLTTTTVGNTGIKTLNPITSLLSLMAHHGVNDLWRILKHVSDIAAFVAKYENNIDWGHFQARCKQFKIDRTSQVGFILANKLFGTNVPVTVDAKTEQIADKVLQRLLKYPLIPVRRSFFNSLSQQLLMRDSAADKLSVMGLYISGLFKPDIASIQVLKLPRPLFFAYYFIKPFRLLLSQFRKPG